MAISERSDDGFAKASKHHPEKMMLKMTLTYAPTHTPAAVAGFATQAARVNERQT